MRRALSIGAAIVASTALIAGCGGGGGSAAIEPSATAPAASAAPVAVAAVPLGGVVTPGPTTPKDVKAALAGSGVVVVAFTVNGVADDDSVSKALAEVRADPGSPGVAIFTYRVGSDRFGDLSDLLGITGTPSVAVIGRDRTIVNLWTGIVDAEILRQSISDAADTVAAHRGAKAVASTSTE